MKDKREFEFEGNKFFVKKPGSKVSQHAQRIYSAEFMKCLNEGLMVRAKLKKFLQEHGVWTEAQEEEEKDISKQINDIEVEIYRGGKDRKTMTLSEGREKAIKMKELRNKYSALISERQSYESNTAESMADNARFDFLVSECTFNEDGTKVYNSYEDYQLKSGEEFAYESAATLAQLMYSLEEDYAKKLPENQFLLRFGLVDDELRLINKSGHLIDREGRLINEEGYYVTEDGSRVDRDGNSLTEDGLLGMEVVYTDDDGQTVQPKESKVEEEPVAEEPVEAPATEVAVEPTPELPEAEAPPTVEAG